LNYQLSTGTLSFPRNFICWRTVKLTKRPHNLTETLRRTSKQLKALRKGVADDGQIEDMQEIDALLGVAKEVTDRQLARQLAGKPVEAVEVASGKTPATSRQKTKS
jgi:hypothetical protein